jgi:hypothetical protein
LRKHTLQSASTIADLHFQQVLDNVARFSVAPTTIPSFAMVTNGSVSVTDQSTFSGAGTYAPTLSQIEQIGGFPILSLFFNPNLARGVAENWSLDPVVDEQTLRRLQSAFGYLTCGEVRLPAWDPVVELCDIPRGWYAVGGKSAVPKDAAYVGGYRGTYVWVMPSGIDGLSRFTLTVLRLAANDARPPQRTIVQRFNADDELQETEITVVEGTSSTENSVAPEDENDRSADGPTSYRPLPKLRTQPPTPLSPKQMRRKPGTAPMFSPKL